GVAQATETIVEIVELALVAVQDGSYLVESACMLVDDANNVIELLSLLGEDAAVIVQSRLLGGPAVRRPESATDRRHRYRCRYRSLPRVFSPVTSAFSI